MVWCGLDDQAWLIGTPSSDKETQILINPLNGNIEERKIPELDGQLCLAHFEEWLFLVSDLTDDCSLLNIYSLKKIHLPPIDEESFASLGKCILTSSPTSSNCTIIFFGEEDNFLLFCHPDDNEWTELPVNLDVTHISTMLMYKEELYVVLLNSIEIFDIASLSKGANTTYVETTSMDKPDHFFSFGIGRLVHLVESCGDLFFVRTCFPCSTQTVIDLDIFKLEETETDDWVRVESIGDYAFFLDSHGKGGQSFRAHDARVDRNCVYQMLSCYDGERLYKICLDNQTISFKLLPEEAIHDQYYRSFNWLLPVRRLVLKPELCLFSETNVCSTEESKRSSQSPVKEHENKKHGISLQLTNYQPIHMVQLISEKLPLKDSGRLRAVCKSWMNLSNPIKEERVWLMYCPKKSGTCQMYNPFNGKQFTLNLKKLKSNEPSRLLFSKDGWVLALQGYDQLCLLNPFTNEFHHLPIMEYPYSYSGIAMSCAPNSSSCVVFALVGPPRGQFTTVITWHYGQNKWCRMKFDNNCPFPVAHNNPVFMDGELYCLSRLGNIGVFNPENNTWRILDKLLPIYSDLDQAPEFASEYCYLLEYNGDLISVFRAVNMDYIRVYKLDRSKMSWTHLEDLGDLTLFLDFRTSIARSLPCKSYNNKLYLPRLHDETSTTTFYYNMKSKMHNPNFKCLKEPYNCVWLEPNLGSHL
ncbi:uncharacterized protein LOC144575266 [Carex rostrata]